MIYCSFQYLQRTVFTNSHDNPKRKIKMKNHDSGKIKEAYNHIVRVTI